jgi:cytidylate kinase
MSWDLIKNRIIVAVDGPAGSGKSTVSREVAKRIGLKYIDSGAIYRAITWYFLQKHGSVEKESVRLHIPADVKIIQQFNPDGTCSTYMNGEDITLKIRDEAIARSIGIISDDAGIRSYVNSQLRAWGGSESIIMDGRDIGTVVFPDADIKIFLDADVEERSRRRLNEYREMGKTVDLKSITNQIIRRDQEDRSRPVGALKMALDSIYINTSSMNRDEVISRIIELVMSRVSVN